MAPGPPPATSSAFYGGATPGDPPASSALQGMGMPQHPGGNIGASTNSHPSSRGGYPPRPDSRLQQSLPMQGVANPAGLPNGLLSGTGLLNGHHRTNSTGSHQLW